MVNKKLVMNRLLLCASIGEMMVGLALLVIPSIVIELLFKGQLSDVGFIISRVAGISLIVFGLACWPGHVSGNHTSQASWAMLIYSLSIAFYFVYLGIVGQYVGYWLWPVAILHTLLALLLLWLIL